MMELLTNYSLSLMQANFNITKYSLHPSQNQGNNLTYLAVYAIFLILGVVGNGCYILVIYQSPELRSTNNILLANLSLANLLIALVVIPFHIVVSFIPFSVLALILHQVLNFFLLILFGMSLLMMMAICIDRCLTIVCLNNYVGQMFDRKLSLVLTLLWSFMLATAAVPLIYFIGTLEHLHQRQTTSVLHHNVSTDEIKIFQVVHQVYIMTLALLLFLTISIILICYTIIFYIAIRINTSDSKHKALPKRLMSIFKSVGVTLIVIMMHLGCLIPLAVVMIVYSIQNSSLYYLVSLQYLNLIRLICFGIGVINPIIYVLTNAELRKKLNYLHQHYCNVPDIMLP